MTDQTQPYDPVKPGDLLTAELFNDVQTKIKGDIAKQISDAVKDIQTAKHADTAGNADNADKLDHKSLELITQLIIDQVLKKIPEQTNYRMIFKRLLPSTITPDKDTGMPLLDKITVIKHDLKACPLVDVYQLDYFKVLCSTGDTPDDQGSSWVNFYLYHSTEKRLRAKKATYDIEPVGQQPYKVLFKDMLELFKGHHDFTWDDDTTLDDLETDFWKTFFAAPNDEFEEDQYCHSPWFEKCCGEKRTVHDLKQSGAWDDIWFQMRPRKTINFPFQFQSQIEPQPKTAPAPTQVQVVHFDFDTLGIALLDKPAYPASETGNKPGGAFEDDTGATDKSKWLNVMMLLKV